jgi:hypothetical protein
MGKGALGALAAYWPEDTARYAHVPLKRVGDLTLHATATIGADRAAVMSAAGPASYGRVAADVKRLAASLRGRLQKGARVAVGLEDPVELVTSLFACFETEMLAYGAATAVPQETIDLFGADLVIGGAGDKGVSFPALGAEQGSDKIDRPDFKKPLIAFAKPDRSGETVHNHKTLAATAIALGSFFMIDEQTQIVLAQPPTDWLSLAMLLAAWNKGGTVWAGWQEGVKLPERVDYLVIGWDAAIRQYVEGPPRIPRTRIGAGALVGIERGFSVARRRRLARRLGAPVLTVLGRSDLGPLIASHPTWFLDDAVGIPLPNVDTRPLNPSDGTPLNIGWDAVESAELGIKSAHAPAGGTLVAENWIRTGLIAEIDPTGLYFLRNGR